MTATPVPTNTPAPPPYITVCASGCDFATIQAAIDDPGTAAGATIRITDPIHTEGDITVSKDVIIEGQGASNTIVQAHAEAPDATDRVFYVPEGATVFIKEMTIQHGNPDFEPDLMFVNRSGGGIANRGTLTLENVVVRDNLAAKGGGIWNKGVMTLIGCTVSGNTTTGVENPDNPYGVCGSGGGIMNVTGAMTVTNSTISNNTSVGLGGGIKLGCEGRMLITNSTISGNYADGDGGAMQMRGALELVHCTIVDNSVREGASGILNRGDLHMAATILANDEGGTDCAIGNVGHENTGDAGTIVSVNNLIRDGSCDADLSGDPLLGPLADNGGSTQTHTLLADSPAIDAIPADACAVAADQLGHSRPQGSGCDIGALEVQGE